jgi:hypothetical protein
MNAEEWAILLAHDALCRWGREQDCQVKRI